MLPALLQPRCWRCVLSDPRGSASPGKDVRALFDKAQIGDFRYLTFTAQKAPAKNQAEPMPSTDVAPVVSAGSGNHLRRALNSVFEVNARLRIASARPPLAASSGAALIFASCAGGVGKTTLCATAARILSSRLSNVLLADRCSDGIVPYYFSLERLGAGGLQTVYPNARRTGYPITIVASPCSVDPDTPAAAWLEQLQAESQLTLVDVPTFHSASIPAAVSHNGQVVVPLVPDIQSVATIARVEELSAVLAGGQKGRSLFVLNRFDEARPLHRDIRTHLEKILDDRLAPISIRESEHVPEALSLGMTVFDHAPQSPVTKDFEQLVLWLEQRLSSAAECVAPQSEMA
jgi:cellulose biosynthesis protein BcsQ